MPLLSVKINRKCKSFLFVPTDVPLLFGSVWVRYTVFPMIKVLRPVSPLCIPPHGWPPTQDDVRLSLGSNLYYNVSTRLADCPVSYYGNALHCCMYAKLTSRPPASAAVTLWNFVQFHIRQQ